MERARSSAKAPLRLPSSKATTAGAPTTFPLTRKAHTIATKNALALAPIGVVVLMQACTDITF